MDFSRPWLRHYPEEVASSYEYPRHNLAKFLVDSANKLPHNPAVYFMGKKMSYSQLLSASYRFANGLLGLGIKKGDRVAIMLPNCPQSVIAYFGSLLMGAVVVQTNPLYMEGELKQQLSDSGALAMVTLDALCPRVLKVQPYTSLQYLIITSIQDYLPFPKNWLYTLTQKKAGITPKVAFGSGVLAFANFLSEAASAPICTEVDAEKDLAVLQYTGGTTGVSKGVMLTHYNLTANAVQNANWSYEGQFGKERYLAALPCFHVFGLTVCLHQCVYKGGMLIMVPRFEVKTVLQAIDKLRPTVFPGAPTMYIALINHPEIRRHDLSSIRICVSGSAPLPLEVQEKFEAITGGRLIEGYGLTEASPVTHANNIWGYRKIGSIGIPFPDTDARIVDPATGEPVEVGEIGELAVKGPQVMMGYWNRPEETGKVLQGGWLLTGDMARVDDEGFFAIMDRKKDMIISSGYNVYPREIEEVLFEHPLIREVAVAGIPDDYRGETVKAYIVLKNEAKVTEKELESWCRERLAAYKIPRKYEFRDSLPKTIVGKVLRRKLMEEELERSKNIG